MYSAVLEQERKSMWSVSAYDDENNSVISFSDIETEEDLKDLVGRILTKYSEKGIRMLEIETLL